MQQIKLWDGNDCSNLEDQQEEINLIRTEIEKEHINFLITNNKINEINIETFGRKCRINKLIPSFEVYAEK
uniref:Uncharacterized protein n=1 Tax=Meloidogyne hapla TaxID=6305 RepID=A0A1I8BFC0_MELHA